MALDVGDAVERVHQQAKRSLIEGDGHGVDGEVPTTQLVLNGARMIDGIARLGIFHTMGADHVDTHGAGKTEIKAAGVFVFAPDGTARRWAGSLSLSAFP